MKIHTPGVFTQVKVTVEGFSPVKIVTELASGAKASWTAGSRFDVPMSSTKMKMKHDQARSAPATVTASPASTSMR